MLHRTVLIIYPHWHPANLAGVHRPRLTGNFLEEFGWKPRVITVESSFFEEKPDPDLEKIFSPYFEVSRVKAYKVTKPRIIGDIGLRAFFQIRRAAIRICLEESIDFVWIPIPSFYMSLIGRVIHKRTGVPYGIDYIDPWVRDISNRKNVRSVLSQWIAHFLEPWAVRNAALITGVSESYYMPVIQRNRLEYRKHSLPVIHSAFPYGFDPEDHNIRLSELKPPWDTSKKNTWIYAGAFLPKSHHFLNALFKALASLKNQGEVKDALDFQMVFIGTGQYSYKSIEQYAADHGLSNQVIEIRERHPYLHILNYLSDADTVMIIGSTEKHYTASKTYQALLSGTPVLSIFHEMSQACQVMQECNADQFTVRYRDNMSESDLEDDIIQVLINRISSKVWNPDLQKLDPYSAKEGARKLTICMDEYLEGKA